MLSPYERILRSHMVLNDDETPLGPPWSPWPPWAPLGAPGPPAPPLGPPGCPRRAILCLELSQRKPVFGDVPDCLYALTDLQGLRGRRRHPWGLADSSVSIIDAPRSTLERGRARPWPPPPPPPAPRGRPAWQAGAAAAACCRCRAACCFKIFTGYCTSESVCGGVA